MNGRERKVVIYALRVLQEHSYMYNPLDHDPLTTDEIDDLTTALESPVSQPVLVIHEGGSVRNALSNAPVAITVIDYDRDGVALEDLTEVPQDDGTMSLAIVEDTTVEPLDKHWADFAEWWEQQA